MEFTSVDPTPKLQNPDMVSLMKRGGELGEGRLSNHDCCVRPCRPENSRFWAVAAEMFE